ncbi:MAG: dTMP kinase [Desulfuromonadales bacterium]|nr:dTMP kinase [Desulfuromonadales bacterium]
MSFFISFEGIEGSGKSTQVLRLQSSLEQQGHKVTVTREPGGCPIANAVRSILLDPANHAMVPRAELLLYAAARAQHVDEVIRPALDDGHVVLCDRFIDATMAYQGAGRGLDEALLTAINDQATGGLVPDLTLLLDLPLEIGLSRAKSRNNLQSLEAESRFELESLTFHNRVRTAYLDQAQRQDRFRVIDAAGDIGAVAQRVHTTVQRFLSGRIDHDI